MILPNLTLNEWLLHRKRHLKMWLSIIVILIWLCKKLLPRWTKFAAHQAIMCSQHSWIFIPRFHKTNKIMCHVIQKYKSLYAMIHIAGLMSILFFFLLHHVCNRNLYLDSKILAHWACKNVNSILILPATMDHIDFKAGVNP